MDSQKINFINTNEKKMAFDELIETRQTATKNLELASINEPIIVEEQKKSFIKRFIAGMTNKLIDVERPEKKSFLEYTINGYNFMADKEVEVDKEYDENGKVIAYKLNGENLSLVRSNKNGTTE